MPEEARNKGMRRAIKKEAYQMRRYVRNALVIGSFMASLLGVMGLGMADDTEPLDIGAVPLENQSVQPAPLENLSAPSPLENMSAPPAIYNMDAPPSP